MDWTFNMKRIRGTGARQAIDWNGNGVNDGTTEQRLQGQECLVFFLGGKPQTGAVKTCLGFSTNALNPMDTNSPMNPTFYDFKSERLAFGNSPVFFHYLDAYGSTNDTKSKPYLYFSSYKTANGYNRYGTSDCSFFDLTLGGTLSSGSPSVTVTPNTNGLAPYVSVTGSGVPAGTTIAAVNSTTQITLSQNATSTGAQTLTFGVAPYGIGSNFLKPNKFQIISAGRNKIFGPTAAWAAATASDTYPPGSDGADDHANFYNRTLGIPTP